MKKIYLALTFAFIAFSANAQQPFITTWEVGFPNFGYEITIPTTGSGYNYTVDFGDGSVQYNVTGNATHTYSIPGVYTITITGSFPRIYFQLNGLGDNEQQIKSVEQWGDIQWVSMESAFAGCVNLEINATDAPDLSGVTDLSNMFYGIENINQSINNWDVSNITNMSAMFIYINSFDLPLNNWDVSNVTDMSNMFLGADTFNQPLNNWDVSNVTDMGGMFSGAISFNQSLNTWNVWNVIDMSGMFSRANSFNQPLNGWDVSNVTNIEDMFNHASSFNQPIENWDVSSITDMSFLFFGASSFNQSLDNWNIISLTDAEGMFYQATAFNQSLGNWDVSNVINMSSMFYEAVSFNQALNNWNVSNVTDMGSMFYGASSFNKPLGNWDVSNVTDMSSMFGETSSFNQPLGNWDVSSAVYMNGMFYSAPSFNQPLNSWDVSNVTNMSGMFNAAFSFNKPLDNWNISNVTDLSAMFYEASSFNQLIGNWDVSNVTNMSGLFSMAASFNQPLNNWNVSNVTNMSGMFGGNVFQSTLFNQSLNNWNVSNVTDMTGMFKYASNFNQPLDNWDISNVTDISRMFLGASSFNQDLSDWDFNTGYMSLFLDGSGLDINNYDVFLSSLAVSGINGGLLGADELEYCNQAARNELITNGWMIFEDNLSLNCNTITGTILYDENNNGCDPNDSSVNGFMININDGNHDFSTFVNNGNYDVAVSGTTFTVSVINYPTYYTVTPPTATVTFTTSDTEQQDFCVTANQSIEDLNVTLLPVSEARPGFEADYRLVVENMGTQTMANASVMVSFDDTKQSFTSAIPAPSATTANQLTFDMANLQPFEVRSVELVMQTFTPPTVNGDDVLNFTAAVTPDTNDHTPTDNTFNFDQIVVNSFDPNDKQVLQGEEIFISQADDYLNYLIRFQNTGTASAINVRVLDTLHPKLDYSTIKPVSTSHDYRVEITDGNQVGFIFENINLPHEAADEPGSHGFIAYKIKPKSDVVIGDILTGDARIYFDFNAAIITNMVSTEIVPNLSMENFERNKIRLYPNPTNGTLNISSETELEKVELFSLTGNRLLLQESNVKKIDLHQFSEGIYFLKITGKNGAESVEKIVKK